MPRDPKKPPLPPEVQALFDEHRKPTHACKRDLHDACAPLLDLGARTQQQLAEYRRRVMAIEMSAAADPELVGKFEHMHQTFAAVEREAMAFVQAGRSLTQAVSQLDRYVQKMESEIDEYVGVPLFPPAP